MKKQTLLICFLLVIFFSGSAQDKIINVLVFSKTAAFRHTSISEGLKMLSDMAQERKWIITATENGDLFTPEFLKNFDVVVFLNPSGDVLNDNQQKNFEEFMSAGKGFVGIHSATDCEYDWPWYGQLVGAYFKIHPRGQMGTMIFENTDHSSMATFKGLESYRTMDEWYSFRENPRSKVHVLARFDETSLDEIAQKDDRWKMGDHPLIWYQEIGKIRSLYTGYGHGPEAFQDVKIKAHIANAIDWAARRN